MHSADTLLRCRRIFSLTAYCLACQFGVPLRSPFSLFSSGGSYFGFIQVNVNKEINSSSVDCRCASANFQCLHLFWWIDLIAHTGPRMKFIFEALVLVFYFTLSLSPTKWSWIFLVKVTRYLQRCLQRCLASKRCSASGLNSKYLNPYIKLKLIELAIQLNQEFWNKMNCRIFSAVFLNKFFSLGGGSSMS